MTIQKQGSLVKSRPPLGWITRDNGVFCFKFQYGGCYAGGFQEVNTETEAHDADLAVLTRKINALVQECQASAKGRQKDLHLIDVGAGQLVLAWATCEAKDFTLSATEIEQRSTVEGLNAARRSLGLPPLE